MGVVCLVTWGGGGGGGRAAQSRFFCCGVGGVAFCFCVGGGAPPPPPHVTRHNTPIHNILSTAPQLNISQKALRTLSEYGNVVPKHVGATIHN
jgi:hypothetical protein